MRIRRDSYLEHDSRQQQDGAGVASIFSGSRFFPAHYGGEGSSDAVAERQWNARCRAEGFPVGSKHNVKSRMNELFVSLATA